MLIAERHQQIVKLVNERKSVRVSELSKLFSVTEETIRRDLEKLESENKLKRSHGGAVRIVLKDSFEIPFSEREITKVKEKKEIVRAALNFIQPGDTIILDASTTAWYLSKALPNIELTVLTNSIKAAVELSSKNQIHVILTGGVLAPDSLSLVGPMAISTIRNYHLKKAFISCHGIHFERGIRETNDQQARIKEMMVECADEVYLMVTGDKFGVQAFSRITDIEQINTIITDKMNDKKMIEELETRSIRYIEAQA